LQPKLFKDKDKIQITNYCCVESVLNGEEASKYEAKYYREKLRSLLIHVV